MPRVAALARIVGAEHARGDHEARARHALGKSTLDLLALRSRRADQRARPRRQPGVPRRGPGGAASAAASTGWPSSRSEAEPRWSAGCAPTADGFAGVVALDLRRLDALVALDEESRLAVLEPGLRGPEAEALLGARGYTLGHFPQSFEYATLGGFAAARSSGQSSAGYGRFDELVLALRLATPAGTLELGRAPKSAAGPDLRQLVLGSEGTLGVITR